MACDQIQLNLLSPMSEMCGVFKNKACLLLLEAMKGNINSLYCFWFVELPGHQLERRFLLPGLRFPLWLLGKISSFQLA